MYLESAEPNTNRISRLMKEKKWDELRILIHSMKPHFDFMGMNHTRELAEQIESHLLEKNGMENIPDKISELQQAINQSIHELTVQK